MTYTPVTTPIRWLAYAPCGAARRNTGPGATPTYSYTGKERDRSGLLYYGTRYYDPVLARFITLDTLYDSGSQERMDSRKNCFLTFLM